jgi:hypothetical protein
VACALFQMLWQIANIAPGRFPDWHPYTKGMERFATPFSLWNEVPYLLHNSLTTD